MRVAFLGLGAMGAPMATNIANAGVELSVYNRTPDRTRELRNLGVHVAESPRDAVRGVEVICTCLSTPEAVTSVLLGGDGAIAAASPGALVIDFSTIDPATSQAVADACTEAGCAFAEAPVSGGVGGAQAGTLTIIVGADPATFERARPILEMVGAQITRVGPVGAGSTIKLINQMLVGINLAGVLEAFVLADRAGIEPGVLYDVVRQSSGNSGMLNRAVPGNLIQRNFTPGFRMDLLLKDLRLVTAMADDHGMALAMASAARRIYEDGVENGLAHLDMTAAVMPIEQRPTAGAVSEKE